MSETENLGMAPTSVNKRSVWWFGTAQEKTFLYRFIEAKADLGREVVTQLAGVWGQLERGSNDHGHILMHFSKPKSWRYMRNKFPSVRWEIPRSPRQCYEYCQKGEGGFDHEHGDTYKEGTRFGWGREPKEGRKREQGRRTDVELAVEAAFEGEDQLSFIKRARSESAWKMFNVARAMYLTSVRSGGAWKKRHCVWLWGGTGVGKSACSATFPKPHARMSPDGQWCTTAHAQGARTLQIDDIADGFRYRQLLRLADGWDVEIPVKGGHLVHTADYVVVTADRVPARLRNERGQELGGHEIAQLERRFVVVFLPDDNVWCWCTWAAKAGVPIDPDACGCRDWGEWKPSHVLENEARRDRTALIPEERRSGDAPPHEQVVAGAGAHVGGSVDGTVLRAPSTERDGTLAST